MRAHYGEWVPDLPDLIRMNQLVRRRIDFAGFAGWYASLLPDQQLVLTVCLAEFAHQAGVRESDYDEALEVAGLPADHPAVGRLRHDCHRPGHQDLFELHDVLPSLGVADRAVAFRLFVPLFGTAEGRVFRGERKEWCNHWWHRDLLDERVVEDILGDPAFARTSMRDDDRVKRGDR